MVKAVVFWPPVEGPAMDKTNVSKVLRSRTLAASPAPTSASISSDLKAMQAAKIRELRQELLRVGLMTLDQQAKSLGLGRSTAWAVLKGNHKCSGLSTKVIKRMLASEQLPSSARMVLLDYVANRSAGAYGHNRARLRAFRTEMADLASEPDLPPRSP